MAIAGMHFQNDLAYNFSGKRIIFLYKLFAALYDIYFWLLLVCCKFNLKQCMKSLKCLWLNSCMCYYTASRLIYISVDYIIAARIIHGLTYIV